MASANRAEIITSILSEAEAQTKEIDRQEELRRKRRTKFIESLEGRGLMKVPDHKKAWEDLKAEFPDTAPPLNRLFDVFGLPMIIETSNNFYEKVWNDEDWFSRAFREGRNPKDIAIINQWTFFTEQLGGPPLFVEWRNPGGRVLVAFTHEMFRMTEISMRRWMVHMNYACEVSGMKHNCPAAAEIFLKFCSDFGYEMVAKASHH